MLSSTSQLHALKCQVQIVMSENECADLSSARLVYGFTTGSAHHCGHMKSNALGPHQSFGLKIDPTITEFENDNSVEVFDDIPIGTITFSDATLADSRVPTDSEFSNHLNKTALDRDIVWQEPLDKWMKYYPYLNAASSELEILTCRQINDCYMLVMGSILALEKPYPGDKFSDNSYKLCKSRLEHSFRMKRRWHIFNLKSDYLVDDREVNLNEKVTGYKLLLAKPYGDISHRYAKSSKRRRNLKVLYLDQQVMPLICQHATIAMGLGAIDIVATEVLPDSIMSSYACADPTLNLENGLYVSILCNKNAIGEIDLKILTRMPKSSLEDLLFNSVGWYMYYINQKGLFKKPNVKTYLSWQEPTSMDKNHNLPAERGDLPSLQLIPNGSECHNNETMGDKDAHQLFRSHNYYNCQQIIFHGHNKMTYIPRPPKLLAYDVEGEIMTEGLMEYLLENVQVKHILTTLKGIEWALTASHWQAAREGLAVGDMQSKTTCMPQCIDVYRVYD